MSLDAMLHWVRGFVLEEFSQAEEEELNRRYSDLFEKLDRNGDGRVDIVELQEGLGKMGFTVNKDEFQDILKAGDTNKDNNLDFQEFLHYLKDHEKKMKLVFSSLDRNEDDIKMSDKTKKRVAARASIIEQLLTEKNFQNLGDHLTELETIHMSIEHLQETDVVRAVYRVLKHCPVVIFQRKAKCLLSKWKTLYRNHCFQPMNNSGFYLKNSKENTKHVSQVQEENSPYLSKEQTSDTANSNSVPPSPDTTKGAEMFVPENSAAAMEEHLEERFMSHDPKSIGSESVWHQDPTRAKCVELLYGALITCATDEQKTDRWQILAREIEECVFALNSKNLKKYKNCIRSKVSNLKNRKNPHLQQNLFSGALSPKEFAEMTAMEMANDELKQLRASYTEACIQEHCLPQVVDGTQTNKIKCRRCEKFNCKLTVIARGTLFLPSWVRSANPDEQMMTYVICNECGEQWYHSKWLCT